MRIPILLLALTMIGRTFGATAYEALQVVKQARGEAVLKQLVQVRGESGQPQPQSWTVLMNDPAARGGLREFVVTGGEIASERTPLRGYSGAEKLPVLDFTRLNLDSDGAFRVANQQATKAQLGFDSANYTLRTNDVDGAPMWVLGLFDYMGAPVGNLQVSAENGKVVRALQIDPDAREKPVVAQNATPAPAKNENDEDGNPTRFGGVFGVVEKTARNVGSAVGNTAKGVGNTVKKTSLHVAGTVQEVLTGERTVDQEHSSSGTGSSDD